MIDSVQIFTPVKRLEAATVAAVLALEWHGAISWIFQRDNPTGDGRRDILHQYQCGRRRFLAGDDDAMLVIESDIVPPPDTLRRLAALDCDVGYGVYRFRVSSVINIFERYPGHPRNPGESLSLHPAKLRKARRQGVTPCSGAGLGCVLIRRHVLEQIDFRMEGERGAHCDTFFNRDVLGAGFIQLADMNVVCGHIDEEGKMLWPF